MGKRRDSRRSTKKKKKNNVQLNATEYIYIRLTITIYAHLKYCLVSIDSYRYRWEQLCLYFCVFGMSETNTISSSYILPSRVSLRCFIKTYALACVYMYIHVYTYIYVYIYVYIDIVCIHTIYQFTCTSYIRYGKCIIN